MVTILNTTLLAAGIFLLFLTYKMYRKEWKSPTWICALLGIVALLGTQEWVQGFFKTGVLTIGYEYGERLNKFQETVGKIELTLQSHQNKLDNHQLEIDQQQQELRNIQEDVKDAQGELKTQQNEVSSAQADVKHAQQQIELAQEAVEQTRSALNEQQKDLTDVQYLVRNLFSKTESELFWHKDTNKMFIVAPPPEKMGCEAIVVFELSQVPIKQSVRMQYHVYTQPPRSFQVSKNIIMLRWGDNVEKLRKKPFYITYVADHRRSHEVVNLEEVRADLTIVADKPLPPMDFAF